MVLKINLASNEIPIQFVDDEGKVQLELAFDKSDESIEHLYKQDEVIKELHEKVDPNKADMESTKELVEKCFDSVLGEGSFDKVYAINPSCMIILQYYIAAVIHIREQLDDFDGAKDLQKYLNG